MRNKRITFIVIALLVASSTTFAQTFGIKAGINTSRIRFNSDDDANSEMKLHPGFLIGGTVDIPFNKFLSLETGLMLISKGFRESVEYSNYDSNYGVYTTWTTSYNSKVNLYYLESPLTLKLSFDVGKPKLFIVTGPSLGIGIFGKSHTEITYGSSNISKDGDVEWGNEDNDFKRLDIGLLFGGGIEIGPVQLAVNYNLGLANISNGRYSMYNRAFNISVAYLFLSKKTLE